MTMEDEKGIKLEGPHQPATEQDVEAAREWRARKDAEIAALRYENEKLRRLAEDSERWRVAYQSGKAKLYAMGGVVADAALAHLPCNEGQLDRNSRRLLIEPWCGPIRERAVAAESELATLRKRVEELEAERSINPKT